MVYELVLVALVAVGVYTMYALLSSVGGAPALQAPAKARATNVKGAGVAKKKKLSAQEQKALAKKQQDEEAFLARELEKSAKGLAKDSKTDKAVTLEEHRQNQAAKNNSNAGPTANVVVDTEKARNQAKAQGFKLVEEGEEEISHTKKTKLKKIAEARAAFVASAPAPVVEETPEADENADAENADGEKKKQNKKPKKPVVDYSKVKFDVVSRKSVLDDKLKNFFRGGGGGGNRASYNGRDGKAEEETEKNDLRPKKLGGVVHRKMEGKSTTLWNGTAVSA